MKIDTLVLSGGSTKVPAFIGSLRALKEHRIINDTLDGINHIITCSVGMLYGLMLLLKVNDNVIEETIKRFCFSDVLDMIWLVLILYYLIWVYSIIIKLHQ